MSSFLRAALFGVTQLLGGASSSVGLTTFFAIPGGNEVGSSSVWYDPELLAVRLEYGDVKRVTKECEHGPIEVWKGRYNVEDVTIRWLSDDHKNMRNAVMLATEVKTMLRLSHPKITEFIGVAWSSALRVQIVTEFMDSGELGTWLATPQAKQLTWARGKCQIAIDVVEAVVYLHSLNVVTAHRDINSRSILVDSANGVKLSGFSSSRLIVCDELDRRAKLWLAPEVLAGELHTEASDVFSLGVLMYEMSNERWPNETLLSGATQARRGCPMSILALARSCLTSAPRKRPCAGDLLTILRKIQNGEL